MKKNVSCIDCGTLTYEGSKRCMSCYNKLRHVEFHCSICNKKITYNAVKYGTGKCLVCSHKGKPARSGSLCNLWKDGRNPLTMMLRNKIRVVEWSKKVFERDNYTCQECGVRNGHGKEIYLEAHHKKAFSQILSEFLKVYNQFSPIEDKETLFRLALNYTEFWNLDNGITLCEKCHKMTRSNK